MVKRKKRKAPRIVLLDIGQLGTLDERIGQLERLCDQCIDAQRKMDEMLTLLCSEAQRAERTASLAEAACALLAGMLEKRSAAARKANETRRAAAEQDGAAELPDVAPSEGTSGD